MQIRVCSGLWLPWVLLGLLIGGLPTARGLSQETRDDVWLVVDTEHHLLDVMQGDELKQTFENISIGRGGSAWARVRGDHKTPLGNFHIAWVNENSRFYRFFGLDYPNLDHADRAYREGRLSGRARNAVRKAFNAGQPPPQDTPLGGFIGIHGVGAGNPIIHNGLNWTDGCIALTNEQIDQLTRWVRVGTLVVIR
jgi:murein L,D-transpeptidase YafK